MECECMHPAAKHKLPVAGAAALRAKAWAVRWDYPDAWSRKRANNWPNKTRHAAKGSLAMQVGAGGLAHAEATEACKAGILAQLEVLSAEADAQLMHAGFRDLGSQSAAARRG